MGKAKERQEAIAQALDRIRRVEAEEGVTRATLERIKDELIELAAKRGLFTFEDFPPPDHKGTSAMYRLAEDDDHRFALYLSSAWPGKETEPHNHTTWAVIVGIEGAEQNLLWRRTDDGSVDGRGEVEETGQLMVEPGSGIAFMPQDIHSIHVTGDQPTLHFHMYGRGLEQLTERIGFQRQDGTYRVYPPHRDIR